MKLKYLFFLTLFVACKKETKNVVPESSATEVGTSDMYTLETKTFFIDIPQGYAVNEMQIANKYALKNLVKSDSLQYFLVASEQKNMRLTFDFTSNFIDSKQELSVINQGLYNDYKAQFPKQTLDIAVQKDTVINEKNINYLVYSTIFETNASQTMSVNISENGKVVNINFKSDDITEKINTNQTFWNVIKSIGTK